jgi:hypothetical protein
MRTFRFPLDASLVARVNFSNLVVMLFATARPATNSVTSAKRVPATALTAAARNGVAFAESLKAIIYVEKKVATATRHISVTARAPSCGLRILRPSLPSVES